MKTLDNILIEKIEISNNIFIKNKINYFFPKYEK